MVYDLNLFENSRNSPVISVEDVDFDDAFILSHKNVVNSPNDSINLQQVSQQEEAKDEVGASDLSST
jgi:hypothetical protein